MTLIIRKAGILTTVQDLGRTGARRYGVNPNGPMDRAAARIVNALLENDDDAPFLEIHFPAGEIEFEHQTHFAIGGADLDAELDGTPIDNWSTHVAAKRSILKFRKRVSGNRAYLSVEGGFEIDNWLESAATNLAARVGGISGRKVSAEDRIECSESSASRNVRAGGSLIPHYSRFPTVRVLEGPEFDLLTAPSERAFLNEGFTLTKDSNRMGYQLKGPELIPLDKLELVSSPVNYGTIQLLPDGQLIVLMADHQTTGGYPRICNVISTDLPLLAQLGPGDGVSFKLVPISDAEAAAARFERELNFLRVGCRLQTRC